MGLGRIGVVALSIGAANLLGACGGNDDRDSLIEDRTRIGNTQEEAECYADGVIDEFGGDPASDGELSDSDVAMLLDISFNCVGGS